MKWTCCQLGAREHYAIPRALSRSGSLDQLITDVWMQPSSLLAKVAGGESRLRDRFHGELREAPVNAFTLSSILFESVTRARGQNPWQSILARNRWFQRKVVSHLRSNPSTIDTKPVLLSYSYAALEPFRYVKRGGWRSVLVQIDPGPEEEAIVAEEVARVPELAGEWHAAPSEYWSNWREECNLADRIVVNSQWSREGLIRKGVPGEKISIIPLAYDTEVNRARLTEPPLQRRYPDRFTSERPLRVLFLGLINLRKGVARLLEAARILRDEPVEFWMVGPVEIANAKALAAAARVKWFGPVTRKQAGQFYRDADVFILPTLSDGFAITQLEAQANGLPLIVSKSCGKVIENGVNGIVLNEPSATVIAATVRDCIVNPGLLEKFASASRVGDRFTIQALADHLQELAGTFEGSS